MNLLMRAAFVVGAIFVGANLINYSVLGNTGDYLPGGERMGVWKAAKIREACYPAFAVSERDGTLPKLTTNDHRVAWQDLSETKTMTTALHCYLVTHPNAICEKNNRAYIVDSINRYFSKFDEMIEIAKRYGDSEITTVKNLWDSPRNRAIAAALRQDAGNGRLIKADFGWTVPAAMRSIFDEYKGATDNCARYAAKA
jgi:ABC-type proline/glycine betaine transport system substrate-binding protein